MRKTAFLLLCGVLMAGVLYAQDAPVKEVTGGDYLVQDKGWFAGTWVRPDADITQYSKLYLWDSLFQFREGGAKSSGTTMQASRGDTGPYVVTEDSQEKFKQIVSDAVVKELARSKLFEVADTVGPDTLLVRAAVLDITSNVPPNIRRDRVHLAAVGEATIFFELIDAETGVIQARVGERRNIQDPQRVMNTVNTAPANAATVWSEVEQWARGMAQALRKELEKAKKKANK